MLNVYSDGGLLGDENPNPHGDTYAMDVRVVKDEGEIWEELRLGEYNVVNSAGGALFFQEWDKELYREQVTELVRHLQAWLDTGSLELPPMMVGVEEGE